MAHPKTRTHQSSKTSDFSAFPARARESAPTGEVGPRVSFALWLIGMSILGLIILGDLIRGLFFR